MDASARPALAQSRWRWRSTSRSSAWRPPPAALQQASPQPEGALAGLRRPVAGPARSRTGATAGATGRRRAAPVDRPGHQRVAAERAARGSPGRAASRPAGPRRSTPVWMPISCEHRDEVLAGEVARSSRAAPGIRRARRSSTRSSRRRRGARRARWRAPRRGCCGSGPSARPPRPAARARVLKKPSHLRRVGHPGGVPEGDLLGAGVVQRGRDLEHPLGRDVALVGAPEGGRDDPLAAQARLAGAGRAPPAPPPATPRPSG